MTVRAIRSITPGSFDPAATLADVATKGYATSRRPNRWLALKLKGQAMRRYGLALTPLNWHSHTLDHLIPLELGGMPTDPRNLWPQTRVEARRKDVDENRQRRLVLTKAVTLAVAQQFFIDNWTT